MLLQDLGNNSIGDIINASALGAQSIADSSGDDSKKPEHLLLKAIAYDKEDVDVFPVLPVSWFSGTSNHLSCVMTGRAHQNRPNSSYKKINLEEVVAVAVVPAEQNETAKS